MKYTEILATFSEIPDEITLCINISGCPIRCPDCHSKYLWEDVGKELTRKTLYDIIDKNEGITCVCFMGGDASPKEINILADYIKVQFPDLKVAWYSGQEKISEKINLYNFDYVKIGPYIKEKGPLNEPTTNQSLYKVIHTPVPSIIIMDITHKFWKKVKQ